MFWKNRVFKCYTTIHVGPRQRLHIRVQIVLLIGSCPPVSKLGICSRWLISVDGKLVVAVLAGGGRATPKLWSLGGRAAG